MYLADDLSRLPVRHITRPHDNKSDPNIETGTYGLFSTCEQQMRSGIVKSGAEYIIFMCRWDGRLVVAGYYRLAWKAPGTLHSKQTDYVLAADTVHFVNPPIPIADLPEHVASAAGTGFRLSKRVDSAQTQTLISILNDRSNALSDYLSEIERLEQFQLFHSGYRYVSWQQREPFSWDMALLKVECEQFVISQALLKRCPFCGSMGTLAANRRSDRSFLGGMSNGTPHIYQLPTRGPNEGQGLQSSTMEQERTY